MTLLDSSDSSSDEEEDRPRRNAAALLPPVPGAPLPMLPPPHPRNPAPFFRVEDLNRFLGQDIDAPLEGFELFDDDEDNADGLGDDRPEGRGLFEPFDDAGNEFFPPFDPEGEAAMTSWTIPFYQPPFLT
ncbi:hypothetical protein RhiJN_12379 [Ceratobasidium sp. AG-Ba]|nr:hypothetical protein RhiJN_12379 [Ceratobasidium sp. AG-Ba]